MSATPKWAFWRTRERLSVSEAAYLLCNMEPPAEAAAPAVPARIEHAAKALRENGLVKSKTFDNPPGAAMVALGLSSWVERAELVAALGAGNLAGFGAELLRSARRPREATRPLQERREDALRKWLATHSPQSQWRELRGWSLERVRSALARYDSGLFEDLKPSTFGKFWKQQRICKLRR